MANKLCPFCREGKGKIIHGSSGDVYMRCEICGAHTDSFFGGYYRLSEDNVTSKLKFLWDNGEVTKSRKWRAV